MKSIIDLYMKTFKSMMFIFLICTIGCSNDELIQCSDELAYKEGEIECQIFDGNSPVSRSYYLHTSGANVFTAKWSSGDEIAICFDEAEDVRQFKLLRGENSSSATFYGPIPDKYNKSLAIYPYTIFKARTSNTIEVSLPSEINYDTNKILSGAMPMYAQNVGDVLSFYNLMSVIKISITGNGLLNSVTVSSNDGYSLSGDGHITVDEDGIPELHLGMKNDCVRINLGSVFLSNKPTELFIPIPALRFDNGLKIDFMFQDIIKTKELEGALNFERSVMRSVKPYELNATFDFDNYETKDNEIWYRALTQLQPSSETNLGFPIITNSYSAEYNLGVYTAQSEIVKISGPIFKSPKYVSFVKLPNSVQEIAMDGFKETSILCFDAPEKLRILGTDAFLGCSKLKRVVLNKGIESLGLEAFGDCPSLEYVYLPKTLQTIGAYSFRGSTSNMDHWEGDCPLIDEDRHTLYANSAYGMVQEQLIQIDNVAGCNLTEYIIPENALFTQNYALSGLKNLKRLVIHDKFLAFGLEVFSVLKKLETIVCYSDNPPSFNPDETFTSSSLKEIKVPKGSIDKYKKADGWKEFSDIIMAI